MSKPRYDTSVEVRAALDRMGLTPFELAALLVHWGDPRPQRTVYRAVNRFCSVNRVIPNTPWMLRGMLYVMETQNWRDQLPAAVEAWEAAAAERTRQDR